MECRLNKEVAIGWLKRYQYVMILMIAGIILMFLPSGEKKHPIPEANTAEVPDLQQTLSATLSKVSGAGEVEVLLTQARGEEYIFQTNEKHSGDQVHIETVTVMKENKTEEGLIKQVNPPTFLGAIVLCQGADSASVRLAMVEAVSSITGLTSDCITVLKMK